jgi:hypothetical protein
VILLPNDVRSRPKPRWHGTHHCEMLYGQYWVGANAMVTHGRELLAAQAARTFGHIISREYDHAVGARNK